MEKLENGSLADDAGLIFKCISIMTCFLSDRGERGGIGSAGGSG